MKQDIGLFYGSTTGATESVAQQIEEKAIAYDIELSAVDVADIDSIDTLLGYKKLILGTSTWYYGEHQGDWEETLEEIPDNIDLSETTVALFGLGDQEGYPDWFLDAMGMIAEEFEQRGAKIIGEWSAEGYDFDESKAILSNGNFCGLALDDDCQPKLTDKRVDEWLSQVLPQLAD